MCRKVCWALRQNEFAKYDPKIFRWHPTMVHDDHKLIVGNKLFLVKSLVYQRSYLCSTLRAPISTIAWWPWGMNAYFCTNPNIKLLLYIYTYIHVYIIFPYIPIISILSIPMWFVDGHSGPFQILFIKRCQSSIDFSRFSPLVLEISRDFLDVRLVSDSQHFNRSFRKNPPLFLFRSKGYLGSSEDARWGARRSPLRILAALANWKQIPGIYRSFSHEKIAIDRGCPIVIFDYWRVINIYI
jgi:hypothetical protein